MSASRSRGISARGATDPPTRSTRISRVRRVFVLSQLALLVLVSGAQARATAPHETAVTPRLAAIRFAASGGWHVLTGRVHPCPGTPASRCSQVTSVASTTRWRDCLECAPHRTVNGMPAEAIAIRITIAIERPLRIKATFPWPVQVRRAALQSLEGLPGRIGAYQASTRVGSREVFLSVYFGRSHPTAAQLHAANSELRHSSLG